jgi:hypothetical protein
MEIENEIDIIQYMVIENENDTVTPGTEAGKHL